MLYAVDIDGLEFVSTTDSVARQPKIRHWTSFMQQKRETIVVYAKSPCLDPFEAGEGSKTNPQAKKGSKPRVAKLWSFLNLLHKKDITMFE